MPVGKPVEANSAPSAELKPKSTKELADAAGVGVRSIEQAKAAPEAEQAVKSAEIRPQYQLEVLASQCIHVQIPGAKGMNQHIVKRIKDALRKQWPDIEMHVEDVQNSSSSPEFRQAVKESLAEMSSFYEEIRRLKHDLGT